MVDDISMDLGRDLQLHVPQALPLGSIVCNQCGQATGAVVITDERFPQASGLYFCTAACAQAYAAGPAEFDHKKEPLKQGPDAMMEAWRKSGGA